MICECCQTELELKRIHEIQLLQMEEDELRKSFGLQTQAEIAREQLHKK